MTYHKTLPVQSQFRGCGMSNGTIVGYLKADDWTKYENNQAVDFNAVDIMVELPDAYYCTKYIILYRIFHYTTFVNLIVPAKLATSSIFKKSNLTAPDTLQVYG